jgi:hypothetical protein
MRGTTIDRITTPIAKSSSTASGQRYKRIVLAGGTAVGESMGPDGPVFGVCVVTTPPEGPDRSTVRVAWMMVDVGLGVAVLDGVDVAAAVHVGNGVMVLVGAHVAVATAVSVVLMLTVAVMVPVGASIVPVGVPTGLSKAEEVPVIVGVAVCVAEAEELGVPVCVGSILGVGVRVGVLVAV